MLDAKSIAAGAQVALFGAGGLARELASSILHLSATPENVRFVVDAPFYDEGFNWNGIVMELASSDTRELVIALGSPDARHVIAQRMGGWANAKSLCLGKVGHSTRMGRGVVIAEGARVTSDVILGDGCLIQMDSTVAHDCVLGQEVNVNPGARVNGHVILGDRVTIGAQASIREGIQIVSDVMVGMGAAVVKDINEPGIYAGNPARRIK